MACHILLGSTLGYIRLGLLLGSTLGYIRLGLLLGSTLGYVRLGLLLRSSIHFNIILSNWLLGGAVSVHNAHLFSHTSLPSLSAEFVYVLQGELLNLSLAALAASKPEEEGVDSGQVTSGWAASPDINVC